MGGDEMKLRSIPLLLLTAVMFLVGCVDGVVDRLAFKIGVIIGGVQSK
jgi:hypothetical protein